MLMILAALAALQQNPFNLPVPSEAEMMHCVPAEARTAASMEELSREQRLAVISCVTELTVRGIRPRLPMRIDELTTVVDISTAGPQVRYSYRVDVDAASVTPRMRAMLERSTLDSACASANMRQAMQFGGSYHYRWADASGRPIHEMLVDRCP